MGNSNGTADDDAPQLTLMFPIQVFEKTETLLEKVQTGSDKFIQWMNMNPVNYKDFLSYFKA